MGGRQECKEYGTNEAVLVSHATSLEPGCHGYVVELGAAMR